MPESGQRLRNREGKQMAMIYALLYRGRGMPPIYATSGAFKAQRSEHHATRRHICGGLWVVLGWLLGCFSWVGCWVVFLGLVVGWFRRGGRHRTSPTSGAPRRQEGAGCYCEGRRGVPNGTGATSTPEEPPIMGWFLGGFSGWVVAWVGCADLLAGCVISTPVILYGGYIYTNFLLYT